MPIHSVRKALNRWMGRGRSTPAPSMTNATFRLMYENIPVGVLQLKDGEWTFEYSDEFRRHTDLRPLVGFADLEKTYRSRELWPFFAMRIPSLKQTAIADIVRKEQIDPNDEVKLLRRFGQRTISNPFELMAT